MCIRDSYYPIDPEKSKVSIWCTPGAKDFKVDISIVANPKPRHEWSAVRPPTLVLYGFKFSKTWRDLVGFKTKISTDWNDGDDESGNFYDGIHQRTNDHEIEFVSLKDNKFRIRWRCLVGDYKHSAIPTEIDAHVNFCDVYVSNQHKLIALDEAKKVVQEHFDLDEFEEPKYTNSQKTTVVFKLK